LSKHLFDLWVLEQGLEEKTVGLKYFNVYGPNENHKGDMRSMVNKAFKLIKETGKMQLFKSYLPGYRDGEQMRDFIYIKDAVDMTLHFELDESGRHSNGLFNVGTGIARKWIDMANALFNALKMKPEIEFVEMPESIRNQYQYFTEAKIDKLINTGYKNKIMSLEAGVYDYVVNYLEKDEYLKP
jgi:ADP-L-glycero-D-manno-heptose 6-epimerase